MSNPESHTPSNEENEAFERWQAFYGEEMLGEPTPEPTPAEVSAPSEDEPKLTIDLVRESINEGRRKAGLEERTDFKDYGTDISEPEPTEPESKGNKVEIGEINIKQVEKDIEILENKKTFYNDLLNTPCYDKSLVNSWTLSDYSDYTVSIGNNIVEGASYGIRGALLTSEVPTPE
jgi:hypothetical protein